VDGVGWTYPEGWKGLRNPHLRMLLLRRLHEIVARKDAHTEPAFVRETVQLLFDQSEFGTEPGAEVGNALFDINEGRAVFRLTQAVLKAAQPGSSQHKVRAAEWATVQTLALSLCAILVKKGVAHFTEDSAAPARPEAPPYNER
jgi:hypothetical protein